MLLGSFFRADEPHTRMFGLSFVLDAVIMVARIPEPNFGSELTGCDVHS